MRSTEGLQPTTPPCLVLTCNCDLSRSHSSWFGWGCFAACCEGPALDLVVLCLHPSSLTDTTLVSCYQNTPFFVKAKPPAVLHLKCFASTDVKSFCLKHPGMTLFSSVGNTPKTALAGLTPAWPPRPRVLARLGAEQHPCRSFCLAAEAQGTGARRPRGTPRTPGVSLSAAGSARKECSLPPPCKH